MRDHGIIGYIGDREASGIILDGLRRVEYRGYDSAGIAILNDPGLRSGDPLVTRFCGLARMPTRCTVADWLRQSWMAQEGI